MTHYVIYLPGVGDHRNGDVQKMAIQRWRKFSLDPYFWMMGWSNSESYKNKFNKILKFIDELTEQHHKVSLVGVSAGASMAMNIYHARSSKVNAAIFICGKINNPQTLGTNYKSRNPALLQSVSISAKYAKQLSIKDKAKMLTINPIFDGVVDRDDAVITGVRNKIIFSVWHPLSIYLAITLYKRISIKFLKSKALQ